KNVAQEFCSRSVEPCENLLRRFERCELILVVKRFGGLNDICQFEVGQQRSDDQWPNIVRTRKLVERDIELVTVSQDVVNDRVDACRIGSVAISKIFEHGQVVAASQHLANGLLSISARTPDFLRIVFKTLRQVEVVDVTDIGF